MRGVLYGVGVGPGDPDLLTLKAVSVIGRVDVLAYPTNAAGDSLARRIASPFIPEKTQEYGFLLPMRTERGPARDAYDAAAGHLDAVLLEGRTVALLCEGDPFFYGSFMYLFTRLAERHEIEVIPGVTSLTASAAMLGRPLAARDDTLKILPATLDEEVLRRELLSVKAAAIVKIGRCFEKIRRLLEELNLHEGAMIVENATLPEQKVMRVVDVPCGARSYFAIILIYRGGESW